MLTAVRSFDYNNEGLMNEYIRKKEMLQEEINRAGKLEIDRTVFQKTEEEKRFIKLCKRAYKKNLIK